MQIHSTRTMSWTILLLCLAMTACGTQTQEDADFHTSGSAEADQRAQQRIARSQQIRGVNDDDSDAPHETLYMRLGGAKGIDAILDDFLARVIVDPRVNWGRKGVMRGGVLGVGDEEIDWQPTTENMAILKKHMAQFLAVATGGPAKYEGKGMKQVHEGMNISNVEFDAAVGDLKASLEAMGIPTQEQKELLAIIESTRPQIVEKR